MKRIKMLLLSVICLMVFPFTVDAASAKISVNVPTSVVVGNTITVTVTLSSNAEIGSWEMDLNYNSAYLKMTQAGGEGGGTSMVNSSSGTKKKTYTFKFKALKSGSVKISVPSYIVYANEDLSEMDVTSSSDTVKIMTQAELEATYSSDAYLKSLKIDGYNLTPKFDKKTYKYDLEVENDVTSVKVSASVNDSKSSLSGTGEYTLEEGSNKIELEVIAQKGNSLTYIINVYRKELDPITMSTPDGELSVIRKVELLPQFKTFSETQFLIGEDEVPGLVSDITGYELIGLKDDLGNTYMYIFEDGEVKEKYQELEGFALALYPVELENSEEFDIYEITKMDINGMEVEGYQLNKKSNEFIFYAHNVLTGDYNYYVYNTKIETITEYSSELREYYEEIIEKYKYVFLGLIGFIILLMFIMIIRKPKKIIVTKSVQDVSKVDDLKKDEIKVQKVEEIKVENDKKIEKENKIKKKNKRYPDEIKEEAEVKEEVKTKEVDVKKIQEVNSLQDESNDSEEVYVSEINHMSKRDQKKLLKQQKKLLKAERKKEKARKEFDF